MQTMVFTLGGFHINDTMAADTDTPGIPNWVYFTVRARDKMFGPKRAKIGDLNDDDYVVD